MMSSVSWLRSAVIIFFALLNTRSHSADIAGIASISRAGSVDSVLLKLIVFPSVTRELVSSTIVSTGSVRGEEHIEKASGSPPSKSPSMIAGWGRRRVKNGECTSNKGECKPPVILATSLLIPTTANYVTKGAPTTTIRLLAPSRGRRTIEDTGRYFRHQSSSSPIEN